MTEHLRNIGVLVGCRVERVITYRVGRAVFHGTFAGSYLSGPVRVCIHPLPEEVRALLAEVRDALNRLAGQATPRAAGTHGDRPT